MPSFKGRDVDGSNLQYFPETKMVSVMLTFKIRKKFQDFILNQLRWHVVTVLNISSNELIFPMSLKSIDLCRFV